jgi:hypothetical protein
MRGAVHPLPLYAFMAWCSVKKSTGSVETIDNLLLVTDLNCMGSNTSKCRLHALRYKKLYPDDDFHATSSTMRVGKKQQIILFGVGG